jgi:hypothetical protein
MEEGGAELMHQEWSSPLREHDETPKGKIRDMAKPDSLLICYRQLIPLGVLQPILKVLPTVRLLLISFMGPSNQELRTELEIC